MGLNRTILVSAMEQKKIDKVTAFYLTIQTFSQIVR